MAIYDFKALKRGLAIFCGLSTMVASAVVVAFPDQVASSGIGTMSVTTNDEIVLTLATDIVQDWHEIVIPDNCGIVNVELEGTCLTGRFVVRRGTTMDRPTHLRLWSSRSGARISGGVWVEKDATNAVCVSVGTNVVVYGAPAIVGNVYRNDGTIQGNDGASAYDDYLDPGCEMQFFPGHNGEDGGVAVDGSVYCNNGTIQAGRGGEPSIDYAAGFDANAVLGDVHYNLGHILAGRHPEDALGVAGNVGVNAGDISSVGGSVWIDEGGKIGCLYGRVANPFELPDVNVFYQSYTEVESPAVSELSSHILYSLEKEGPYTNAIPALAYIGSSDIWYIHVSDFFEPVVTNSVRLTVLPKNIADAEVVLGPPLAPNGEEQEQTVARVVVDGLEVTYTVEGNRATEVGSYELTITGTGNFTGSITVPWMIKQNTAFIGEYLNLALADIAAVPRDEAYSAKVETLPKGLKLMSDTAKTNWWIEGVPTEPLDFSMQPAYVRCTVTRRDKTKMETLVPLQLTICAAPPAIFPDGRLAIDYSPVSVTDLWPAADATWTFKGWPTGVKYTTKLVTSKVTDKLTKVTMLVTNALPLQIYGKPTKAGSYAITATFKRKIGTATVTETRNAMLTVWGDDGAATYRHTSEAYIGLTTQLDADVSSVAGLPTGLKFTPKALADKTFGTLTAGTVYGTPTKPGVYAVTQTRVDKSKETFLWRVVENTSNIGAGLAAVETKLVTGVVKDFILAPAPGAKVAVTGLPAGLKVVQDKTTGAYSLTGTPTKAGSYTVVVKTTLNGVTVTERFAITVSPLPAWAVGTFQGAVSVEEKTVGIVDLTTTAVGKLSGKLQVAGTNWTVSISGLVSADSTNVVAVGEAKTGSLVKSVSFSFTDAGVMGKLGENGTIFALQNGWKDKASADALKTAFARVLADLKVANPSAKAVVCELLDETTYPAAPTVISLTLSNNGTVKAAAKYVTGCDANGKDVIYSASCSSVLLDADLSKEGVIRGVVSLYFPPEVGKFKGVARLADVVFAAP